MNDLSHTTEKSILIANIRIPIPWILITSNVNLSSIPILNTTHSVNGKGVTIQKPQHHIIWEPRVEVIKTNYFLSCVSHCIVTTILGSRPEIRLRVVFKDMSCLANTARSPDDSNINRSIAMLLKIRNDFFKSSVIFDEDSWMVLRQHSERRSLSNGSNGTGKVRPTSSSGRQGAKVKGLSSGDARFGFLAVLHRFRL